MIMMKCCVLLRKRVMEMVYEMNKRAQEPSSSGQE